MVKKVHYICLKSCDSVTAAAWLEKKITVGKKVISLMMICVCSIFKQVCHTELFI